MIQVQAIKITPECQTMDDGRLSVRLTIEGLPREVAEDVGKAMMEAVMNELAKRGELVKLDRDPDEPLQ